ncbi:ATP-binding protein [Streptomyces sp. ODS28]|uniref:ATP-binding protein n=1 Tax=Streptomyces sp. ODS28 TaxID=3136688 RepID=UPI0031F1116E
MSVWWSLQLRREAASVPLARRLLLGALESAGVDDEIAYELSVALTEACANAVEHGARVSDGSQDAFRVTAYLHGDRCRIEVADSGPGFRGRPSRLARRARALLPADRSREAECGRGLYMIESLTDHVRTHDRPGRGGAVVSFDKTLKWQENGDRSLLKAG